MSVRDARERGRGWEVRWREGGRERSRTFTRKGDAVAFDLEVKRRRQLGPLAGFAGTPLSRDSLLRLYRAAAVALISDLGVSVQELVDELERIRGTRW